MNEDNRKEIVTRQSQVEEQEVFGGFDMSTNNDMTQTANTNISNKIYKDSDEAVIINNFDHEQVIKGLSELYSDNVSYDDMKIIYNTAIHDLESFKTKYDSDIEKEFVDKISVEYRLSKKIIADIVDIIAVHIVHPNKIQNYFNNRNITIPLSERFSIIILYKNKNYTISILDGDKQLGSPYLNKKSLFNIYKARDKELSGILQNFADIEQSEADKLIVNFNTAKENEFADQIKQLKIRYDEYVKEISDKKLTKNQYMGKIVNYPFKIVDDKLYIEKIVKVGDDTESITILISRAFTVKSIGEIKDKGDNESIRFVELQWLNVDGIEKTMWVEENYILDSVLQRDALKPLSIVGTRRSDLTDYYSKVIETNKDDIEVVEITKIGGWKDNFTEFVTEDRIYGYGKHYKLFDNQSMENIHQKGTLDGWIEGTYQLLNDPVFAFITYSGICALLQRPLGIPNFNKVFKNNSSTGKTTGGKLGSSIFGNPYHMMITSNASKQGIPNKVNSYNDVPVHIDEIKQSDIETTRELLYNISSGQKRIVATKNGGIHNKKHETFTTNVLYTMEEELFDESVKMGQLARTISILRVPAINPEAVKKFEDGICNKNGNANNYGFALELLIPKIIRMIQDGTLKAKFEKLQDELKSSNTENSSLVNRLIEYYAGLALAGEIFNEAVVNCPENKDRIKALNPVEIVKDMMKDYMEQKPDETEGQRAIKVIIDWFNGNKLKFNEPEQIHSCIDGVDYARDQVVEFYGYFNDESIDIFSYKVKEVLEKHNFNHKTILNAWKADGFTECKSGRTNKEKCLSTAAYELVQNNEKLQKLIGKSKVASIVSINKSMVEHLLVDAEKLNGSESKEDNNVYLSKKRLEDFKNLVGEENIYSTPIKLHLGE